MNYFTEAEFRRKLKTGTPPTEAAIRKTFSGAMVLAAGEQSRRLQFTISTAGIDRHGDTVAVSGWDLKAFRVNPVTLWSHDPRSPIGKAVRVWTEDGKLKAIAEFMPADLNETADKVSPPAAPPSA
jgi:hypothetical protein